MASPESLEPPGRPVLPAPPVPLTPGSKEPKGRLVLPEPLVLPVPLVP
jgi:hypothetical protein